MKNQIRIVFLKDVPGHGLQGEVKSVSSGFAKNFLLARGLASLATPAALAHATRLGQAREGEERQQEKIQSRLKKALKGLHLIIPIKVNEQGAPYGSIGKSDIVRLLHERGLKEVTPDMIRLEQKIDALGDVHVPIRLSESASVELSVTLRAE